MLEKNFTIAVIDDNVGDADLIRHHLTKIPDLRMEFLYFDNPDHGVEQLLRRTVDFIFLDYRLGAKTGLHALKTFRDSGNLRAIIILATQADASIAAELMKAGGDDYLLKGDITPNVLLRSMAHAHERWMRREAERTNDELLEKTLAGTVDMLIDQLSTLKPKAFSRGERVQKYVRQIYQTMNLPNVWEAEVAAMLSQIAFAHVADEILRKIEGGERLTADESRQLHGHNKMISDMVRRIPRLGGVAAIIAYRYKRFDGRGQPADGLTGEEIPIGARAIKVAFDFDTYSRKSGSTAEAIREICDRSSHYDPRFVEAITETVDTDEGQELRRVAISELVPGMILGEHLQTASGTVIVPKGEPITEVRRERLRALAAVEPLKEPVAVHAGFAGGVNLAILNPTEFLA